MLLKGYSMNLPLKLACSVIRQEIESDQEARAWELYQSLYPLMAVKKLKFMPFTEFLKKSTVNHYYTNESDEEIIEHAKRIAEKAGEPFGNI